MAEDIDGDILLSGAHAPAESTCCAKELWLKHYIPHDFAAKVSDLDFWSDTATKGSDYSSTTDDEFSVSDIDVMVHQYGMLLLEILTGKVVNCFGRTNRE
jgi:hypothetical protein